jgi:hypothetical protein
MSASCICGTPTPTEASARRHAQECPRQGWPGTNPACGALNPERTYMCDLPAGHEGDHKGEELPTVVLDEDL